MAMFSVHMGSHMLLAMAVPILLALGGPLTLALRALPEAGEGGPDGPRTWLASLLDAPVVRVLTHPVVALVLFVGSFFVLYFSPLFAAALPYHWAHQLMNLTIVVVGYLFFWAVIGVDPLPRPLPHVARLALLLASMPFHAFFGVAVFGAATVIGQRFYGTSRCPGCRTCWPTRASAAGSRGPPARSRCSWWWSRCSCSGHGPTGTGRAPTATATPTG